MAKTAGRSWADKKRALYPAGKPTNQAKAIHRRFVAGPLPRLLPIAAVLEVPGRLSGTTIAVPLATVPYRGEWYLVSMFGQQSNWVRNLRAAGGHAVLTHGRRRPVRLVEVPSNLKPPIIKRYLLLALGARPHFPISWRAPLSQYRAIADTYPVFRIHDP
jgi:F420H(2)-dependent quinone reductase